MTTGSVRGKCCALQASHSRRQPAAAIRVGAPQLAQWPWRACQSRMALAWPRMATASGADQALRRRWCADRRAPDRRGRERSARAGRGSRRFRSAISSTAPSGSARGEHRRAAARRARAAPRSARRRARRAATSGNNGSRGAAPRGRIGMSRAISATRASARSRKRRDEPAQSSRWSETRSSGAPAKPKPSGARGGLEKGVFHASSLAPPTRGAGQAAQSRLKSPANQPDDSLKGKQA